MSGRLDVGPQHTVGLGCISSIASGETEENYTSCRLCNLCR